MEIMCSGNQVREAETHMWETDQTYRGACLCQTARTVLPARRRGRTRTSSATLPPPPSLSEQRPPQRGAHTRLDLNRKKQLHPRFLFLPPPPSAPSPEAAVAPALG